MSDGHARRLMLVVRDAKEFEALIERSGSPTGIFVPHRQNVVRSCAVGQRTWIWIVVADTRSTISLEGAVVRRRLKAGGPELPSGVFVSLSEAELASLDRLVRFLDGGRDVLRTREHLRYPLATSAAYTAGGADYLANTRDLSLGGAALVCRGPLPSLSETTLVELQLGTDASEVVRLDSRIAWAGSHHDLPTMGVAFERGGRDREVLARFLKAAERRMRAYRLGGG